MPDQHSRVEMHQRSQARHSIQPIVLADHGLGNFPHQDILQATFLPVLMIIRSRCLQTALAALCIATIVLGLYSLLSSSQKNAQMRDADSSKSEFSTALQERGRNLPVPDPSKVAFPDNLKISDLASNFNNFSYFYSLSQAHMDTAMHWIDLDSNLPVMRLSAQEEKVNFRAERAAKWVSSQSLAVVATARNAMPGVTATVRNLRTLCLLFAHCSIVFLENDSHDDTREFLYQQTKSDPSITLIGCGKINSPDPCHISTLYSSGKAHQPGPKMKRSFQDEVERGQVMSALRNQLLAYVYSHLATNHSLLLTIDPDLYWAAWEDKTMLQGLYYFASRPQLDSLCASTYYNLEGSRVIYDSCTLDFFVNRTHGVVESRNGEQWNGGGAMNVRWPFKVATCFQGLTFYRMSSLYSRLLFYKMGHKEQICDHITMSRQLNEKYIDPNMLLHIKTGVLNIQ